MNNASTPTTPADPHRTSYHSQGDNADDLPQSAASEQSRDGGTTTQNPSLSQAARDGLTKKLQFMMHLSISLDTVVYAELCALYYMEYDETFLLYTVIHGTSYEGADISFLVVRSSD